MSLGLFSVDIHSLTKLYSSLYHIFYLTIVFFFYCPLLYSIFGVISLKLFIFS